MNARDNIKPKSIRVAILQALSDGAITTIDDLQIKMDEKREKIINNIYPAAAEGLIKRLRDDVTKLAAYQITAKGRELLAKYASGKVDAPADVVEAVVVEKPIITPGVKVEVSAVIVEKDAEITRLRQQHAEACNLVAKVHAAAMGTICGPVVGVVEDVAAVRECLNAWHSMAHAFDCYTPQDIANKFSECAGIIATPSAEPVGYVIQRPAKPLVRFTKAISAETRAMAFARTGQKAQVFALTLVGTAVPGAEWREA